MRAIASLLVLLTHIAVKGAQYGNGALKGFAEAGGAGVDLFFIISGYIMCVSTYGQQLNFAKFITRRIDRIIPLYWLITTMALIVYLYNSKLINTSGGETSILASYTLIPNGKRLLDDNGWTLSYEFFFYILFGLFIHKSTYKAMLGSSMILLALIIAGLCVDFTDRFFTFATKSFYIEFVFGMGCFYIFNIKNVRLNYKFGISLFVSGLLLFAWQLYFGMPENEKWRGFDWGIKMLLLFIGLLSLEPLIQRSSFLAKRLFLEIGNSSYSLYLIHPFVLSGAAMSLKHFGLTANPYVFASILFILSVATGHFAYLYIERPLIALAKKYSFYRTRPLRRTS